MDRAQHIKLRNRVRQIIRQRAAHGPEEKGGFLNLIPMALSALPSIVDAGKRLFSGSGKHKANAKTRKPNHHAIKVKRIMEAHPGMKLAEASRLAAAEK